MRRWGKYLFHLWLTISSFVTVIITCFPSTASFYFVYNRLHVSTRAMCHTFRHEPCATRFDTSHVPLLSTRALCHTFRHEPCVTRFDTSHVPLVSTRAMCHTFRHGPCATRFDTRHVPHVSTRAMCHCQTFTEIRVMRTKMCCALIRYSKYNMTILCSLLFT